MADTPENTNNNQEVTQEAESLPPGAPSRGYRRYVLGVLLVIYIFNFIDRQILAILAQDIKADLLLSDTQIGILSGLAFGIFYATLGIPIAQLADKYSRVNIIAVCLTIWSGMTALSGLVTNYAQLLVARIFVGIGEAGGSPPSHSILADYFPVSERASALGIYTMGGLIGVLFGYTLGGWINEFFGWRAAFLLVGLPGVALAILLKLTVREPQRGFYDGGGRSTEPVPFTRVVRTMWGFKSFRFLALGAACQAFTTYAMQAWMPAFLIRSHGLSTGEVGTALGLIIGIAGGGASFLGGYFADRLGLRDMRWHMWICAAGFAAAIPASFIMFGLNQVWLLLGFYVVQVFGASLFTGPTFGMTQTLAPPAMRAAASALLFFILSIIGLVLGPTSVGLMSDLFQVSGGLSAGEALRWSLLIASMGYAGCVYLYMNAAKHLRQDLERSAAM